MWTGYMSWWDWLFWPGVYSGIPSYYGHWWSDTVTIHTRHATVDLGSGHDHLTVNAEVDVVRAGWGDDTVVLNHSVGRVDLGLGNDRIETSDHTASIDGGWGHDTLVFHQKLAQLDVTVDDWGQLKIYDKLTGECTTAESIEKIVFDDVTVTYSELRDADAPVVRIADGTGQAYVNDADPSVNVIWSRALHKAIVDSDVAAGPTVAARAIAMVHTAIYDAWASFDATALRVAHDLEGDNWKFEGTVSASTANMTKAMSYAAYTVLVDLYPDQKPLFDEIMEKRFHLDPAGDGSLAAETGIDAGEDMLAQRASDGSNQANNYASTVDYTPVNSDPDHVAAIDKWTPERVPDYSADQKFLTPHWGKVEGFSIAKGAVGNDFSDLTPDAPESFLLSAYEGSVVDVKAQTLKLSADAVIDGVAYKAGDVVHVSKAMIGVVINPAFIEQAQQVINISANLTDKQKVIAEFWEDGVGTSFPPGTAMFLAEYVSARDNTTLEQDAKMFMAVGNAQLDASIASWNAKLSFDYVRPIRAIRCLGELDLIGEEGVDEVTGETGHVIRAWAGIDPETGKSLGVKTVLAENFVTYQQPGLHPSPPFAEYVSGHSTFSAAGAEVLKLVTGSDKLDASVTIASGASRFEPGSPLDEVTLHWETFSQTAEQSGMSRLYGGIHFMDGNTAGLELGHQIGQDVFEMAQSYWNGTAEDLIA